MTIPIGFRYIALSSLSFSVMSLLVKLAGRSIPVMELVLARAIVVSAFAYVLIRHRRGSLRVPSTRLLIVRGVVGFVALSCFYYSVVHLPLAEATVIHFTNPVFTALLAVPVLGERLRPSEGLLALVGLLGVALVARPAFLFGGGSALDPLAVVSSLTAAILAAAAYVLVRLMREVDANVIVFYFAAVSIVLSLPFTAVSAVMPRGWDWLVLLGVGTATWGGQMGLTLGLQRERAGRAMSVGYLQIVFATIWGALFFDDLPDGLTLLGGAVIVLSTVLLGRARRPDEDGPPPA